MCVCPTDLTVIAGKTNTCPYFTISLHWLRDLITSVHQNRRMAIVQTTFTCTSMVGWEVFVNRKWLSAPWKLNGSYHNYFPQLHKQNNVFVGVWWHAMLKLKNYESLKRGVTCTCIFSYTRQNTEENSKPNSKAGGSVTTRSRRICNWRTAWVLHNNYKGDWTAFSHPVALMVWIYMYTYVKNFVYWLQQYIYTH